MNIEQIRESAPVGATHYCDDCLGFDYVRMIGETMYVWDKVLEQWIYMNRLNYEHDFKPL